MTTPPPGQLYSDPVTGYARDVVDGKIIAGPYVRLACQRHLRDLDEGAARGLKWFWPAAEHMLGFFRFVRHSKGEWRGKPLELGAWQVFCLGAVHGWMIRQGERWVRRFRTSLIEIPKKNGKSTLMGGVSLHALVGDGEPGAEVYATATKKDQAKIVFNEARQMVLSSPELRSRIRVLLNNLSDEETYSKCEPLSSDENTGDGINPSCAVVDELHRFKTRGLMSVIRNGMGARAQPLFWIITTAGDDRPDTPYDAEHNYAIKVLTGALEDDSYFAYIACPDEGDAWDDPATWPKANPNFGVSVSERDLAAQALAARSSADALADFKRLRLNLRSSDAESAIKMEVWKLNTQGAIDPAALRGRECWASVDLSSKTDITSELLLFKPRKAGERWVLLPRFWVPEQGVDDRADRDRAPYRRWIRDGWLRETPGNRVDYRAVLLQLVADAKEFRPREFAFDPWNAGTLEADLQAEGITVVEFPQRTLHYAHPTKEFLAMLLDAEFEQGGNPVLQWMASNLRLVKDHNGNPMPSKKNSTGRIDGIATAIMALGRAISQAPAKKSFWETAAAPASTAPTKTDDHDAPLAAVAGT
jgi:phage terminase large subunit-like protein